VTAPSTGISNNYAIPFPVGPNRVCDMPQQNWQPMANQIDAGLTLIEANIPRLVLNPFARMSNQVGYTISGLTGGATGTLQFDTVSVDTDNMADLSISAFGLFPQREGIFECGAYVHYGPTNATAADNGMLTTNFAFNPDIVATINFGFAGIATCVNYDGGLGNTATYASITQEVQVLLPTPATPGPAFTVQFTKTGTFTTATTTDQQQIAFSLIWMRWLRDLP
jgi:hypothetical protein